MKLLFITKKKVGRRGYEGGVRWRSRRWSEGGGMYTEELDTGRLAYEVLSQYLLENDRPGKAR